MRPGISAAYEPFGDIASPSATAPSAPMSSAATIVGRRPQRVAT
jgi:hypothetical protein